MKSIPTILNIEYLEGSTKESQKIRMFYHNYLFNYLSRNNYKIVFLDGLCADSEPSWDFDIIHIPLTTLKIDAIQKSKFDFLNDGFSYLVLNKTMLYSVLSLANNKDSANMWYQGNKYFFSYINNFPLTVNKTDEPAFLFAHIPCPHLPFVFDRDGNFLENPTNYWEHKSLDKKLIKSLYLEQYIYVTKRTINIVNEIFKISKKEPVILLMSDHGPRRISAGIDDAIQHRRVLNAVYFPDGDYTDLYDNIAPVNTLRVVLNKYFGEKFKMLEDR
ncbi:hypothetical protein KAJ27_22090 [bacterium]|nr:hypothetical protein [bacterium]